MENVSQDSRVAPDHATQPNPQPSPAPSHYDKSLDLPSGDGRTGDIDIVRHKLIFLVIPAEVRLVSLLPLNLLNLPLNGVCSLLCLLVWSWHRVGLPVHISSHIHLGVIAHLEHVVGGEVLIGLVVGWLLSFTCNQDLL